MGNVTSRVEDGGVLVLRDQSRLSIASLTVTNARGKVLLSVVPNVYPATRVIARKDYSDENLVEFVQDPESTPTSPLPPFLARLHNDDELVFNFSFIIRQTQIAVQQSTSSTETLVNGLTFAFASTTKDLDNLVIREFHADPNIHKNPNVELVGDYSTGDSASAKFDWSWKWRPPKPLEDRGGGWRSSCSFSEYDQRAHKLQTLATFSFWVQNTRRTFTSPHMSNLATPAMELSVPTRMRIPSSQSTISAPSESDHTDIGPPSPPEYAEPTLTQTSLKDPNVLGVTCQRPGEDVSAVDDGPLFRATMKALEQKTGSMRTRMKKVLRKAEAAQAAQVECNGAAGAFMEALREASISNAHAIQPALDHYFERIAKQILQYERQNTVNLQRSIIDPLSKIYNIDIKQAEAKKKDFEEESKEYYAYVSRYLGQRQDSLKEKKRNESDTKYQDKRRRFELKRFDYSSFMQDLHGGRKEQEVLSQLTKYAETQSQSYLHTAKKVGEMTPQLDALIREVRDADKEFNYKRTEREEKRRTLEKSTKTYVEPEASTSIGPTLNASSGTIPETDLSRSDSTGANGLHYSSSTASQHTSTLSATSNGASSTASSRPTSGVPLVSPDRFKGIRDLEEKDHLSYGSADTVQHRKEGLLWALSRPDSHVDMKGLNKQAWHKFWIVLDQGRLSEYSNWKQRLDLHMEPIDLRMASVREARNAERRFCFEVITPHSKRVYQAPSEEDMHSWINALNNALQNAVEGRAQPQQFKPTSDRNSNRDIGSVLTGKSSSYSGHHHHQAPINASGGNSVYRHRTVGARPQYVRTDSNSFEENPSKLLNLIRENDQGNRWCADCNSEAKVDWVSINLGIVLCIECSGIHRSLGTHISKIRSLTLDTTSFTTDIVEALLQIGNRISNMVWEAKLDQSQKPAAHASREQRLRFITSKYVARNFVAPIGFNPQFRYATADETLLASIKRNDIHGVLYALALRANPNATDRSRNTHSIFLALAAADPAPPGGSFTSSPALSPSSKGVSNRSVHAFPVAEILVQNGGLIPESLPAFPLSQHAQLYVDQRSGKGGSDTLGALPKIGRASGAGFNVGDAGKEGATKLQKKNSVGGKLAVRSG
ncbi:uncharacterized protein KY384_009096 [Bacidia gigantensis]|uniref:uncharacterized protein n=1 Tax=Bacidia gigantensis TaxID=2732470 RepID=UPI001D03646A|nr:uncharacterized protein KY384_009096 [Bacidia gigantensis]KAG8525452.1 hypothetical protein KY384_009096 [Bacidia gigantensis]